MPCHVPATSVSSRRRSLYPKRLPTIAAKLDLSKPGEAWAENYLRRASTGKEAFWRPLAIHRDDAALLLAVQWLDWQPAKDRYSVVTLSLTEQALSWRKYQTADAAKKALAKGRAAEAPASGKVRKVGGNRRG